MAHGGKRTGSGRKVNPAQALSLGAASALRVLKEIKHEEALRDLWKDCGDARVKAYIVFRLMEFAFGRPTQRVEMGGIGDTAIQVEHTIKFGDGSDPHKR